MNELGKAGAIAPNGPWLAPPSGAGEGSHPYLATAADWHGPGTRGRRRNRFTWQGLLWSMLFPPRQHRISPTVPGLFLIAVALGIGTAAYNTSSNILFLTLALLLACLLLNGLLSWFNFMGVSWRLRAPAPWRVGHAALVTVEARNTKSWLPTYGLWFDVEARAHTVTEPADDKVDVRAALAAADRATQHERVYLRERLDAAGGAAALEWVVRPARRGVTTVELAAVGSFFPFGFLRKNLGANLRQEVLVWPAQVAYEGAPGAVAAARTQGERVPRAGAGDDLLALRRYQTGDSHRLIHWKASARLRTLMVRQFAAEAQDGFWLRVDAVAAEWPRPEQFELLCSLAATLAEDLYAAGKLRGVAIGQGPWLPTRQVRDVEGFLDALAMLEPQRDEQGAGGKEKETGDREDANRQLIPANRNIVTFAPEGSRGVAAFIDGIKAAAA